MAAEILYADVYVHVCDGPVYSKSILFLFMSSNFTHVQWMTYCEGEICHSLAHSLRRYMKFNSPKYGENSIYGHKNTVTTECLQ